MLCLSTDECVCLAVADWARSSFVCGTGAPQTTNQQVLTKDLTTAGIKLMLTATLTRHATCSTL